LQNFVQLCNKKWLSQFKKYADKHIAKNEEPQERPDIRMVQSCLNSDGTRTLVKYDEKIMLKEFARYIAKKEQPISMPYYGRLNLSKLRVPWDINTRWNSSYRMLHRVLPYKHVISEILRN
jgi:hypothetical protein